MLVTGSDRGLSLDCLSDRGLSLDCVLGCVQGVLWVCCSLVFQMFGGPCQLATIFWGCLGLLFMACVGVCFEEQLVRETIETETKPKPRHNITHTSNKTHNTKPSQT